MTRRAWLRAHVLAAALSSCTGATVAEPSGVAASLEVLKDRAEYAELDQRAVEALARAAEARWPQEFSGLTFQRVEHFSAGGVSHWMSIWSHGETGLEFVLLPGGAFRMGSPATEAGRQADELQHDVVLDPFLISRTECTNAAWAEVSGEPRDGAGPLPVSGVSPAEVEAWCREAGLTLPTEAQWEFMCRAGTTSAWAMGADKRDLARFGNIGSTECPESWHEVPGITESWPDGYGDLPADAGSFECNAFGLFDVHGNVNEWCRDHYQSYEVPVEKGTGLRPGLSGERQSRGGNFGGDATAARSARRLRSGPGASAGNKGFGFRPSLDLAF